MFTQSPLTAQCHPRALGLTACSASSNQSASPIFLGVVQPQGALAGSVPFYPSASPASLPDHSPPPSPAQFMMVTFERGDVGSPELRHDVSEDDRCPAKTRVSYPGRLLYYHTLFTK